MATIPGYYGDDTKPGILQTVQGIADTLAGAYVTLGSAYHEVRNLSRTGDQREPQAETQNVGSIINIKTVLIAVGILLILKTIVK